MRHVYKHVFGFKKLNLRLIFIDRDLKLMSSRSVVLSIWIWSFPGVYWENK